MHHSILKALLGTVVAASFVASFWGCDDSGTESIPPRTDTTSIATKELQSEVLCDLAKNVALPIIDDFDARSADLLEAIRALAAQRTEANLLAARQMWRDTRAPWEMCEAFLFGPAKLQQLDPAVDSWPLDQITLDIMLNSGDNFTKEYFDISEGTVKGAHAIEYLLWGDKGDKQADQITPRELEFLVAVTESFRGSAGALKHAWVSRTLGGGGYGDHICNAGKGESIYSTRKSGLEEFINGIVTILVEVSDAKMGIPYFQQNTEFEEARFSGNSKDDFKANLLGVRSLYTGTYKGHVGKGLRDLVRWADTALDRRVQLQIEMAEARIDAITPSFSIAILPGGNRSSVQAAQQSLITLSDLFAREVRPKVVH